VFPNYVPVLLGQSPLPRRTGNPEHARHAFVDPRAVDRPSERHAGRDPLPRVRSRHDRAAVRGARRTRAGGGGVLRHEVELGRRDPAPRARARRKLRGRLGGRDAARASGGGGAGRHALQQSGEAVRPHRRGRGRRVVPLRLRLRGRAAQDRRPRPRVVGLRPPPGRRPRQRVPAVPEVRRLAGGGGRPAATGGRTRAGPLRHHVPCRLAVHQPDGLGAGHRAVRLGHAAPPPGRCAARDAQHRRGPAGPLHHADSGAVARGRRHRRGPRPPALPAAAAGRRTRPVPRGRERRPRLHRDRCRRA